MIMTGVEKPLSNSEKTPIYKIINETALNNRFKPKLADFERPLDNFEGLFQSAAWPSDSERRFYDGHDRKVDGSTPTQALLLRSWIRCFTTIISLLGGIWQAAN